MASILCPKPLSFFADGVIPKGSAVKIGSDGKHVAKCTAATDKAIGIALNASAAAEDVVEVGLPGGGAKVLAGGNISAGDLLASDSNGALVATTTANDKIIAQAHESAVANDLAAAVVVVGNY